MTETERVEARKRTKREWARRNPGKSREYYEAHKSERSEYSRRWREQNAARVMVDRAQRRAAKYNLPFDLDAEYVESITPLFCPVFGTALTMARGTAGPDSPSLDRETPDKGYVRGNVRVLSNKANMMKQNATNEELTAFAEWVMKNR